MAMKTFSAASEKDGFDPNKLIVDANAKIGNLNQK